MKEKLDSFFFGNSSTNVVIVNMQVEIVGIAPRRRHLLMEIATILGALLLYWPKSPLVTRGSP